MSETSKRNLKHDIIYGIPEFKTADELVTFLAEGDVTRRKAALREWYVAGEGLHGLPPDQQDVLFTRSPQYQQYLHDLAEVDKAVPKIAEGLRVSFDHFQKQFLDRNRAQLEEKLKLLAGQEREAADLLGQYKGKLKEVAQRAADVDEKEKKYDAELENVVRREAEQKVLQDGLERRSGQLTDREIKVKAREGATAKYDERERQLKAREEEVARTENELGEQAKKLAQGLSDMTVFRKYTDTTVKALYSSLDGFATYLRDIVDRRSGAQPTGPVATSTRKGGEDLLMPPGGSLGPETALDLDISVALPKPPQPPSPPPKQK